MVQLDRFSRHFLLTTTALDPQLVEQALEFDTLSEQLLARRRAAGSAENSSALFGKF